MLYEEKNEAVLSSFWGSTGLMLIAGGILCLQPMYDYLVYNPQAYDKSYAVNQYTESQVLSLSVKKGDTIDQSFYSYIKFKEIMINIRNLKETTDIRLNLKNKKPYFPILFIWLFIGV